MKGTVKWFNDERGYGFIKSGENDYFVHYRSIIGMAGRKSLIEGESVEFEWKPGEKGKIAFDVRVIDPIDE